MTGDFSKLPLTARNNYTGVLYQQGRVRLDQDDNAEHFIAAAQRQALARDVIGAGVAAVPTDESAGFRVTRAAASATGVEVSLSPGRVWIDGLHLELEDSSEVTLPASYYGPPFQSPAATPDSIGANVRDAVILEAWEESLSAFQDPRDLLEPALGGPDTTGRIQLNFALRLFRLGENEDCRSVVSRLRTADASLGRLTVTAAPVVVIGGDCPVDTGGGYTGLEHHLYRVEVAMPDAGGHARFKWSRFNGGLVGRGQRHAAGDRVTITANRQMIDRCGLSDFYLEAYQKPGPHQPWRVAFTAQASLISDGVLALSNQTGTWPAAAGASVFFRLWDGIRRIDAFTSADTLENGIQLQFDPPSPASGQNNYRPGDYWTFPVRAAGTGFDPSVWPNNALPHGVRYHRAPLAEIMWSGPAPVTVEAPARIHDCRRAFPPLTRNRVCCTYTVGNGTTSFGDFNSIEEAVAHLPFGGGEICLLPGLHTANVLIEGRGGIRIHGCGSQTLVIPREESRQAPIFHIRESRRITIANLTAATLGGTAIVAEGVKPGGAREIEILHNRIVAARHGIVVANGEEIGIRHNRIRVIDRTGGLEAIVLTAEGAWIERNDIGVLPAERTPPQDEDPGGDPDRPRPENPCADPESVYRTPIILIAYVNFLFSPFFTLPPQNPYRALGGIRLSGGAERVRFTENTVNGGAGDGVTLGGFLTLGEQPAEGDIPEAKFTVRERRIAGLVRVNGEPANGIILSIRGDGGAGPQWFVTSNEDGGVLLSGEGITPGDYVLRVESPGYEMASFQQDPGGGMLPIRITFLLDLRPAPVQERTYLGHLLSEILIERNDISHMGLSGIGTSGRTHNRSAAAGGLAAQFGIPVFDLEISGNRIHRCLRNPFTEELLTRAASQGLGGISLGICDQVIISGNRIEHCGLRHIDPVTGIFAALADHIEVRDNAVLSNGPIVPNIQFPLSAGIRGGIVLRAMAFFSRGADGEILPAADQPAARVYDNVVRQPAGQALWLTAVGPVAVENNFLSSDITGPSQLGRLAGAVLILNVGARESAASSDIKGSDTTGPSIDITQAMRFVPDGKTHYAGNQVRLGAPAESMTAQAIWSRGDLGYTANQSDYTGLGVPLGNLRFLVNTLVLGDSVRVTSSRFKEGIAPVEALIWSLVSTSIVMNITAHNQGDHCILVSNQGSMPAVDAPNQILHPRSCEMAGQTLGNAFAAGPRMRG